MPILNYLPTQLIEFSEPRPVCWRQFRLGYTAMTGVACLGTFIQLKVPRQVSQHPVGEPDFVTLTEKLNEPRYLRVSN